MPLAASSGAPPNMLNLEYPNPTKEPEPGEAIGKVCDFIVVACLISPLLYLGSVFGCAAYNAAYMDDPGPIVSSKPTRQYTPSKKYRLCVFEHVKDKPGAFTTGVCEVK